MANATAVAARFPSDWSCRWSAAAQREGFWPMPESMIDDTDGWHRVPRRAEIQSTNRARAEALRRRVLPSAASSAGASEAEPSCATSTHPDESENSGAGASPGRADTANTGTVLLAKTASVTL